MSLFVIPPPDAWLAKVYCSVKALLEQCSIWNSIEQCSFWNSIEQCSIWNSIEFCPCLCYWPFYLLCCFKLMLEHFIKPCLFVETLSFTCLSVYIVDFAFYIIWKPETIYFIKKSILIVVGGSFFLGGGAINWNTFKSFFSMFL